MINSWLSYLRRPDNQDGWDPVPDLHSVSYAQHQWAIGVDHNLIDQLDNILGGLAGKRVLDLGGGPGQYSVEFAKRGAIVTWHDVSGRYQAFAAEKAREHNVNIQFSLGYMDEARDILDGNFDLIFNRICWCYCHSDRAFSKVIYALSKPNGIIYIDTNNSHWCWSELSYLAKLRVLINNYASIKIGHPHPPHGRIAEIFNQFSVEFISIDYSLPTNDRLIIKRKAVDLI